MHAQWWVFPGIHVFLFDNLQSDRIIKARSFQNVVSGSDFFALSPMDHTGSATINESTESIPHSSGRILSRCGSRPPLRSVHKAWLCRGTLYLTMLSELLWGIHVRTFGPDTRFHASWTKISWFNDLPLLATAMDKGVRILLIIPDMLFRGHLGWNTPRLRSSSQGHTLHYKPVFCPPSPLTIFLPPCLHRFPKIGWKPQIWS